ncbi:MAG TPA: glycosyltransferase family 87 protein [Pirellulales bacterium]|nr:glycosyltransferase family 87 protein [Pirellulales bacterium]
MGVTGKTHLAYSSSSHAREARSIRFPEQPRGLTRLDRVGLVTLLVAFVVFSGVVQFRCALWPNRRLGDWNVFARAAWAARTGSDLYAITDDNGFHYLYPPAFAVLLAPLADAPAGESRAGLLPYPLTVLYWYFFNVGCLVIAVHWLATALETVSAAGIRPSISTRRWWALRVWPVVVCLPTVGHTLMRGQVGLVILLFLSGMVASLVGGNRVRAGGWLACAICLKVIPALLLAYPLLRRDLRFLAGCGLGLVVGLAAIPVAARGTQQTWNDYRQWYRVMLAPVVAGGDDTSRARELHDVTGTDSQSFLAMLHNTLHLDRATRPRQASAAVRLAALGLSATALLGLIVAARRCDRHDPLADVILVAGLTELMLLASPVCHLHYFCLSLPLVAALFASAWEDVASPRLGPRLSTFAAANVLANSVPHFPGMEVARDIGVAGYSGVLLICVAVGVLWHRGQRVGLPAAAPRLAEALLREAA